MEGDLRHANVVFGCSVSFCRFSAKQGASVLEKRGGPVAAQRAKKRPTHLIL